jgi:hypothetical protein
MRKLLTVTAIATAMLVSGVANAKDMPDFSDKETYTCDKELIESELSSLVESSTAGHFGLKLLYVKGEPVETSRNSNELRCRIEFKTNRSTQKGIVRFVNEEGHTLTGFTPNARK